MPTETLRRGEMRWRAVVKIEGKIVASKWFGTGRTEERKAIIWERDKRQELLSQKTLPAVPAPLVWAVSYLEHAQKRYCKKTMWEKGTAAKKLLEHIGAMGLDEITPGVALRFLQRQYDLHSGNVANRDRKNLAAAWIWGRRFVDGFPMHENPFLAVDRFPEGRKPRHVPLAEHFRKVLNIATGQNKVMLMAYYFTAARREELFRLKWADVDLVTRRIRLYTRKTKDGSWRADWLPLLPELHVALSWWTDTCPYQQAEYVFVCLDDSPSPNHRPGEPYRSRQHFTKRLCERAEVPRFGLHGIRHLRAVMLYKMGARLHEIQKWLRHESPSTTERYLKSLGLDLDGLMEVAMRGDAAFASVPANDKAPEAGTFEGFEAGYPSGYPKAVTRSAVL